MFRHQNFLLILKLLHGCDITMSPSFHVSVGCNYAIYTLCSLVVVWLHVHVYGATEKLGHGRYICTYNHWWQSSLHWALVQGFKSNMCMVRQRSLAMEGTAVQCTYDHWRQSSLSLSTMLQESTACRPLRIRTFWKQQATNNKWQRWRCPFFPTLQC